MSAGSNNEQWAQEDAIVQREVERAYDRLFEDRASDQSKKLDVIIVLLHKLLTEGMPT